MEGLGVKSSLSTTVSQSYSRTYKQEWETSEEETFTITVGNGYQGRTLWQWVFVITDPFGDVYVSRSRRYGLTYGKEIPPRCEPGYSYKKTVDYQRCSSRDRILPGFEGSLHRPDPQALLIDRYYLSGNLDVGGNYYNDPNGDALTNGSPGAQSSGEVVAWYSPDGEGDSDPVEVGQVNFYLDREAVVTEVQVDFYRNYCFGLDVPKQIEVSIGQGRSFVLDGPATGMTSGHFSVVLDLSDENLEPVTTITLGIYARAFPGAPRFAPGRCGYPSTSSKVGISEVSFVGYYEG